jgi:hypothetical protein
VKKVKLLGEHEEKSSQKITELEAQDFENFQGMVNKALMLENHRGVMERKCKLVHQHQLGSSSRPRVRPLSAGLVFRPA